MTNYQFKPGDILFTRGEGFLSRAIRFFSRAPGEERTVSNHVGIVVAEGDLSTALIVEARSRVKYHTIVAAYSGKPDELTVWRPANLTEDEVQEIVKKAMSYVNMKYGWAKILLHLVGLGSLARVDKWPICSYLVGMSYRAANKFFGKPANALKPDDIWDYTTTSKHYECVMPWTKLDKVAAVEIGQEVNQ